MMRLVRIIFPRAGSRSRQLRLRFPASRMHLTGRSVLNVMTWLPALPIVAGPQPRLSVRMAASLLTQEPALSENKPQPNNDQCEDHNDRKQLQEHDSRWNLIKLGRWSP